LDTLRQVKSIIRLGRVLRIGKERVDFEKGSVPATPGTLYVDCTADGLKRQPPQPIFHKERILLQPVLVCQPAFSGALLAHVEARYKSTERKNKLCRPVPHPQLPTDYFSIALASIENIDDWVKAFGWRLLRMRLFIGSHVPLGRMPRHILVTTMAKGGAKKSLRRYITAVSNLPREP
jgi:hypothetical protein